MMPPDELRDVEKVTPGSPSAIKSRVDVMKLDVEGLMLALGDTDPTHLYYLDLETGEVVRISEFFPADEDEKLMEAIEEGIGKRYLAAPRMLPRESYEDLVDFIETVGDENLKEKLYIAIDGPGAFRRFKNVLLDYPEERERWFKFNESRLRERLAEWLIAEGIMDECEIEITEAPRENILSLGIEEEWKEIGPSTCLECGCGEGFETRHFILSRLPEKESEEEKLKAHMRVRFGVESFGVSACALKDGRSILDVAKCPRCGSQEVVFDF